MPLQWRVNYDLLTCDQLKNVAKPALVVRGKTTNTYFAHTAERVAACLPKSELVVLPDVNHDGPDKDPAGFASLLEAFVAKN